MRLRSLLLCVVGVLNLVRGANETSGSDVSMGVDVTGDVSGDISGDLPEILDLSGEVSSSAMLKDVDESELGNRVLVEWSKTSTSGELRAYEISEHVETLGLESAERDSNFIRDFIRRVHGGKVISFIRAVAIPELRRWVSKIREVRRLNGVGMDVITVSSAKDAKELAQELVQSGAAISAEVDNPTFLSRLIPDDSYFSRQWGLDNTADNDVNGPELWSEFGVSLANGFKPVVGLLDTGVVLGHEDLASQIWVNEKEIAGDRIDNDGNGYIDDVNGWDFVNQNALPVDDNNHGTHCAGVIAASGGNGVGVAGVHWSARIMSLKTMNAKGSGTYSAAIEALNYAAAMGADLTSNSWGGTAASTALQRAIQAANMLHVCAAGNDARSIDGTPQYPASYTSTLENVISVGALDQSGNLASFSNFGTSNVDVAAPGVSIVSTCFTAAYCSMSGTSMATPFVAGVAATALSVAANTAGSNKNVLTPLEVKNAIQQNGKTRNSLQSKVKTASMVDAFATAKYVQQLIKSRAPSTTTSTTTTTTRAATTTTTSRATTTTTTTTTTRATTTTTTTRPQQALPVDCIVGAWTPWTACSTNCGMGNQSRTRKNILPSNNGAPCPTDNTQVRTCIESSCSNLFQRAFWEYMRRTQSNNNTFSIQDQTTQDHIDFTPQTGDVDDSAPVLRIMPTHHTNEI